MNNLFNKNYKNYKNYIRVKKTHNRVDYYYQENNTIKCEQHSIKSSSINNDGWYDICLATSYIMDIERPYINTNIFRENNIQNDTDELLETNEYDYDYELDFNEEDYSDSEVSDYEQDEDTYFSSETESEDDWTTV